MFYQKAFATNWVQSAIKFGGDPDQKEKGLREQATLLPYCKKVILLSLNISFGFSLVYLNPKL
jgi:hypothetical protein